MFSAMMGARDAGQRPERPWEDLGSNGHREKGIEMGNVVITTARRRIVRGMAVAVVAALVAAGCSESEDVSSGTDEDAATALNTDSDGVIEPSEGDGETVVSRFQGAQWFNGDVPAPEEADASQAPIKVGFMNVDSAPIGAMPELHAATDAAAEFINAELGGVDGRPIEIVPCLLSNALAPEEAAGCARQLVDAQVVAVLGGIGLSNGPALTVFEDNGIPYVGGIPVNEDEMRSPASFQFSGGSPGAFTAFAEQAVAVDGAEKVSILYADYPSIKLAALDYGAAVARARGAEVTEVAYPMVSQDFATPVQKALESDPDAVLVVAADLSCAPVMQALVDLKSDAAVYMVGSCADVKVLDEVGIDNVKGFRFNVENRLDQSAEPVADTEIYTLAMEKYAPDTTPMSAATVAFRSAMNLWAMMETIGPDATPQQITEGFQAADDVPSFDGHSFTCAEEQIPGYPSMCAPQQIIAELQGRNQFVELSDGWVDVPTILRETIA
jgi:branched-chain amino acid transport system substrate-binding protein